MNSLVSSIALYGSETWAMGSSDKKTVSSFELWCWRHMLKISWKEHRTNAYVLRQVGKQTSLNDRLDHHLFIDGQAAEQVEFQLPGFSDREFWR